MRDHFAAVKARLFADAALVGKVHDTALVDSTGLPVVGTYVVLFGGSPDSLESGRFTAPQSVTSDAEYVYTVRSVSTTPDGVRSTQTKVAGQLIGHRLVVAGRNCAPAYLSYSGDVERDKATTPPLFYADQEFSVNSFPA